MPSVSSWIFILVGNSSSGTVKGCKKKKKKKKKKKEDILNHLVQHPFTVPLSDLPTTIKINELSEGANKLPFVSSWYTLTLVWVIE